MRKRVLHIIVTVACIAATIETARFSWLRVTIDNAPRGIWDYISGILSTLGWACLSWIELKERKITNWIIRRYNKLKARNK